MKTPRKPPTPSLGAKLLGAVILLLISPILFLAILFIIGKIFLVYAPALRVVQTVPRYWLTWKHIKLVTGMSTGSTLSLLLLFTDGKFFECRLREDTQLQRLSRHLKTGKTIPKGPKPIIHDEIIYYEFRMIWKGGRKWPSLKDAIRRLLGGLQPKPALQPAYAR